MKQTLLPQHLSELSPYRSHSLQVEIAHEELIPDGPRKLGTVCPALLHDEPAQKYTGVDKVSRRFNHVTGP